VNAQSAIPRSVVRKAQVTNVLTNLFKISAHLSEVDYLTTSSNAKQTENTDWKDRGNVDVIGRLENMYPGMNVDVRDENYIWCRGRIVRTLNKISEQGMRIKYLVVEYEKNDKREEFVYSSSRIAKGGFFTNNVLGQEIEKYRGDEIGNVEELGNPVKKIKRLMEIGKKVEEEDEYN
jgi:molybdopterin converting factor small subunit